MSKSDPLRLSDYLAHMVEAIERIHAYVADLDEAAFLGDTKTQDAVVRNFEILGEATRNIERYHRSYADAHPEAEWASMVALRNRVYPATSRWTTRCCGKRSTRICPNCIEPFAPSSAVWPVHRASRVSERAL